MSRSALFLVMTVASGGYFYAFLEVITLEANEEIYTDEVQSEGLRLR